ncbi:hypothetical protein [Nitrososphaera viennensis]|uniref:Peptidase M50 n=2 Tax=Nitrososphaera viennensis TaxID=1034015 RepID=A0A060HMH3_9ARCH|nr:hypothetical protein [Nitrososphaera viennensis]AIC14372.1 hypothetical protein NVIE_001890 [Nitrososphaera viennensis EN76]UVS69356.1 hypothetical protein NWT39_00885 [Nitrososphaera viennensis]
MAALTPIRLNRGVIQWSVMLYIALVVPVSLLHETGHAFVCSASGFGYSLWIDGMGGHTVCAGAPGDSVAYGAMGGVFGLLGSAAIIGFWAVAKRRKHPAVLVVGLAYAVDQAAKLILEGFFTPLYASGATDLFLTALQLASWIGLTIYFARTPRAQAVASRTK